MWDISEIVTILTTTHHLSASSVWFIVGFHRPGTIKVSDSFYWFQSQNIILKDETILALLSVTAATNIFTSILITSRLIYAHGVLRASEASTGYGKSPYLNAITICVESSTLITCVAVINIVFRTRISYNPPFLLAMLPQICVCLWYMTQNLFVDNFTGHVAFANYLSH